MGDEDDRVERAKTFQAIEKNDIEDDTFWGEWKSDATKTFERGIEWNFEAREKALEMMKVLLLLGSIYVGFYNFRIGAENLSSNLTIIVTPFFFLLLSVCCFLYSYMIAGPAVLGPDRDFAHDMLSRDPDTKEYQRITAAVYVEWAEDNFEQRMKADKAVSYGLVLLFASLGAFSGVIMFY